MPWTKVRANCPQPTIHKASFIYYTPSMAPLTHVAAPLREGNRSTALKHMHKHFQRIVVLGIADHPENPAAFRDGLGHRPVEHLRVAVLHTPRTELVKRGAAGIRQEDFRDPRGDTVAYQLVQGVHEFLPKADVRPHDELERREILGGKARKGAVAGRDVDPVALGVQLEIR